MREITLHNVRVSGGGKISFNGYDKEHRVAAKLSDVLITDHEDYKFKLTHADITLGPGAVNFEFPQLEDSTVTGKPSTGKAESCTEKLIPFPVN